MKITNDINKVAIFVGDEQPEVGRRQNREKQQNGNAVFAGNLNSDLLQNQICRRKEEAKKKALKIVTDVWEGERTIDEEMQARRQKIDALKQENRQAKSMLSEIAQEQETLKETYGVTDDSKEQLDLELLRRKKQMSSGKGGSLTPEELEYVEGLEQTGLTEYQLRQLDLDKEKQIYEERVAENDRAILEELAIIRGTRLERLKHNPMVKAQKQADAVLDAAGREVIDMVVEDAKEKLDEEQEERQEKAEVIKEKREQREELIKTQRKERDEQEELLEEMPVEEMLTLKSDKTDVKKEIQNIVNKMKLVAEDIKGSVVDEKL